MKDKYKKENFEKTVRNSNNYAQIAKKLNMSRSGSSFYTFKKYIKLYDLDISHFEGQCDGLSKYREENKIPLKDILIKKFFL